MGGKMTKGILFCLGGESIRELSGKSEQKGGSKVGFPNHNGLQERSRRGG